MMMKIAGLAAMAAVCSLSFAARAQQIPAKYQTVLDTLGKTGDYAAGVLKVNIPRSDLKITVDGVPTPTSFGFGGWLAMTPGERGAQVMMGDLVLLQDEVNPVMSALLDNGLEVTALHNHFFWEEPRIFFMHVHGMGSPADLARRVKPAIDLIGHVSGRTVQVRIRSSQPSFHRAARRQIGAGALDTGKLDQITGKKGDHLAGGVYKYTVGRDDLKLKEMGATLNARMGVNTWAAFYGSDASAVVAGDVAMTGGELTSVLKALRSHGLDVVAIHNHMIGTRPMIIFLHYWGRGPADQLARGFRAALDVLGHGMAGVRH